MAQNAKPAGQKPEDPTVAKKSSKKMIIIVGVVLAVAGAGGGGWYFAKGKSTDHPVEEVHVAPPKVPVFLPLEPFVVNLKSENSDQYLQMGISMKFFESEVEGKIKTNLPEIRSKILQLLTTKTAAELLTAEGKNKLVKDILWMSNPIIGYANPVPPPVAIPASPVAPNEPMPAAATSHAPDAHGAAGTAPAAPTNAPIASADGKGIVDVLFTSFIIQ